MTVAPRTGPYEGREVVVLNKNTCHCSIEIPSPKRGTCPIMGGHCTCLARFWNNRDESSHVPPPQRRRRRRSSHILIIIDGPTHHSPSDPSALAPIPHHQPAAADVTAGLVHYAPPPSNRRRMPQQHQKHRRHLRVPSVDSKHRHVHRPPPHSPVSSPSTRHVHPAAATTWSPPPL